MLPLLIVLGTTCIIGVIGASAAIYDILLRRKIQLKREEILFHFELDQKRLVLNHNSMIQKLRVSSNSTNALLKATGAVTGQMNIRVNPETGFLEYALDNRPHPNNILPPVVIPPAVGNQIHTQPHVFVDKNTRIELREITPNANY